MLAVTALCIDLLLKGSFRQTYFGEGPVPTTEFD